MWNRYTQSARRSIWQIQKLADQYQIARVDPEHLLLALLIENNGISAQILEDAKVAQENVKVQMTLIPQNVPLSELPSKEDLEWANDSKRILELASDEARRMNLDYIGTEHILLGLIRQKDTLAAQILTQAGITLEQARTRIRRIIFGEETGHWREPESYEWIHPSMKFKFGWCHFAAFIFLLSVVRLSTLVVATRSVEPGPFKWTKLSFDLPPSIKVYEGVARSANGEIFRAWYADVDYNDSKLRAQASLSSLPSRREAPSIQAQKIGALVAINGGYFDVVSDPAKTYSLVFQNGKVLNPNVERVGRSGKQFFVTRSAFGIFKDRWFDVAWIGNRDGKSYVFPAPVLKPMKKEESSASEYSGLAEWKVREAVGGGPRLIHDGKIEITYEEELFPGSGFPNAANYSRAAIGGTKSGHLILFATGQKADGNSTGLTLLQLAKELKNLGCAQAMNLDGGGSQSLVVKGRCINRAGNDPEREVTSIFAILPNT